MSEDGRMNGRTDERVLTTTRYKHCITICHGARKRSSQTSVHFAEEHICITLYDLGSFARHTCHLYNDRSRANGLQCFALEKKGT